MQCKILLAPAIAGQYLSDAVSMEETTFQQMGESKVSIGHDAKGPEKMYIQSSQAQKLQNTLTHGSQPSLVIQLL